MTNKKLKLRLEKLVTVCGGSPNYLLSSSTEEVLDCLGVYLTYMRFDLECTRKELQNARKT